MDDPEPNTDTKSTEWLRNKLNKVWTTANFCGICLEENDNLCPLEMEFVISKQKFSKSFVDILNYVFNEDIENIVASTGVCESCTEKALQAYIFIHNTRQLSFVMDTCVSDLYSKVVDLSEELEETIDCENANIMIVLESEPQLFDIIDDMNNMEVMPTNAPKMVKIECDKQSDEAKDVNSEDKVDYLMKIIRTKDSTNTVKEVIVKDIVKSNPSNITYKSESSSINQIMKDTVKTVSSNIKTTGETNDNGKNLLIKKKPAKTNLEIYLKGGNIVINPIKTDKSNNLGFNVYKCSECNEVFTAYRILKEHEKAKHKAVVYQCDVCNKVYNTLQYLNIHYKTHMRAVCKICHLVFPKTALMQHLRTKHATAMQVHPCKFCDLVYYSEEALETHFKAVHLKNCVENEETKNQCAMCLRNNIPSDGKRHKCKFQCSDCFVNPCIHFRYLTSFREQVLNHSTEIKCLDCDYVTKRKEYLITHANREHLNHHPFVCNDCGTQFYTKMSLRVHIEQYHNANVCEYCDFEFKRNTRLKDHKESCKSIVRPYPCANCVATFNNQEELTNHENLRHKNLGFSCNMCYRRFLTSVELDEHVVTIHSKIQCKKRRKNITCTLCDIKFRSVKEMLEHEKTHGPDEKFPCKVCSKQFHSLKKLYVHKQRHYDRIQCSGCKKRVVTSFYPQHEVRCPYKRSSTLAHMCETCGKSFHLDSLLRVHQKIHVGSSPCSICGKMLKPKGLEKHLQSAHGDNKIKRTSDTSEMLSCNFCGHKAKRKWVLEAHINRYHLKIKPFVCSVCSKEFCGKARLKEHMATHTNANTCYCSVCGKKFANRVCLKLHFRIHTGENPYECDVCGEKFRTSSIMNTHKVKKHLEKTVQCPMCDSMFYMVRDMRHHFKKTHWKHKDKPFNVREILPEEYYHMFEDGRLAKLNDTVETVVESDVFSMENIPKTEVYILEEVEQ